MEGSVLDQISPFDDHLIAKFNELSPFYSSYPTLNRWKEGGDEEYRQAIRDFLSQQPDAPLYLYVHIPFCKKLCYYCICNIQISSNRERIQRFVDTLCREIDLIGAFFKENGLKPNFREVHLGGGTPSHLDHAQMKQLVDRLGSIVDLASLDEFAMEIDPRTVDENDLFYYQSLGIDRISFGVQDFDPVVQDRINRVQPFDQVQNLLTPAVREAFKGINFDLLFGLPMQTRETFSDTVAKTKELSPDRITLIKYAHVPNLRKHMQMIDKAELTSQDQLPLLFHDAVESFSCAGYEWAGISGLAKPTDDLGAAVINGTVGRNFSGPSPGRADNIIGVGPTTTAAFGDFYFQSEYDIQDYYQAIDNDRFPIIKCYVLNEGDRIRRNVIFDLQCHQKSDLQDIGERFNIDAMEYFSSELKDLEPFIKDQMVELDGPVVRLTALGRYFVPQVCSVFDGFLRKNPEYEIHGP